MSWSLQRQIIIFLIVTGFFVVTAFILWLIYKPQPSCFDGKQNQDELGIDCGGICAKVCLSEISSQPVVWWQRGVDLGAGQYGLVALIENKNDNFAIERLDYQFKVFDDNQNLLATVPGFVFVNPNERIVIYEPKVALGQSLPNRVVFEIGGIAWKRVVDYRPAQISVTGGQFTNLVPNPQAQAVVSNNSLETYENIDIYIVLSDSERNVFAASRTFVEGLAPGESRNIFFNWPTLFDLATSSQVIIDLYSRVNTLADGD